MPPKRSKKESNSTMVVYTTVSTQTETDFNDEEKDYQKQIKLLQKEVMDYKTQIIALQSEINILKSKNNLINNDKQKIELIGKNMLKIRNEKISSPKPGITAIKGCNCKGNCSSKICGCVKKNIPCQEFCRCNDAQCQNQESEKENVEQAALSNEGQHTLEKLVRLNLNQETLHASEKKSKRGLFSPFTVENNRITNAASPFISETRRKLFTQDSDDIVDIDSDADQTKLTAGSLKIGSKEHEETKNLDQLQSQLSNTPIVKRTRNLKATEKRSEGVIENNTEVLSKISDPKQTKKKQKDIQHLEHKLVTKNVQQSKIPSILINNVKNNEVRSEISTNATIPQRVSRRKSKSVSPVPEELNLESLKIESEDYRTKNLEQLQSQMTNSPIVKRSRRLKVTEKKTETVIENNTGQSSKISNSKEMKKKQKDIYQSEHELINEDVDQKKLPSILLSNTETGDVISQLHTSNVTSQRVLKRKSKSTSPSQKKLNVESENKDFQSELHTNNTTSQQVSRRKFKSASPSQKELIVESENKDFQSESHTNDGVPLRVLRKKSKSVSPDQYVFRRKYTKTSKKIKSRSVSPVDYAKNNYDDENAQLNLGKVQHSPQPIRNTIESISINQNIQKQSRKSQEFQTTEIPVKLQNLSQINLNTNSNSFESNASESSSGSNQDILDISLNPMIPKRQLPRSPINAAGTVIIPGKDKRFSPPKKELAVVEVDWEQHQSELIMCQICKRKFFPHRIEKHTMSCKGI